MNEKNKNKYTEQEIKQTAENFFNMLWGNKIDANWISVKERVPEKEGNYLCFCNTYQNINVLQWLDGKWMFASAIVVDNVTHWMPLPTNPIFENQ